MTGSWPGGFFCLAGICLFALRYPGLAIAAAPLFGFFSLMVFLGNRAVFYSAPAFWFGGAYLLAESGLLLARQAGRFWPFQRIGRIGDQPSFIWLAASCLGLMAALISSPLAYLPRPSFSPQIITALDWAAKNGGFGPDQSWKILPRQCWPAGGIMAISPNFLPICRCCTARAASSTRPPIILPVPCSARIRKKPPACSACWPAARPPICAR